MSFDEDVNAALDRTLMEVRTHFEEDLRTFVQELLRAAEDERRRTGTRRTSGPAVPADMAKQLEDLDSAKKHADELRRSAEAQIFELRRNLDDARAKGQQQLEEARRSADEVLGMQVEAAVAEGDKRVTEAVSAAKTESQEADIAKAERLAEAIVAFDDARTFGDVLDQLAIAAGDEVDRAAVLLVKEDRLTGWQLTGFGPSTPTPKSIDLALGQAGLAGVVVATGETLTSPDPAAAFGEPPVPLPPFARDAGQRYAMAFPLLVGGGVVAVLYADVPRLRAASPASRWPSVLTVLVRYAARALEVITMNRLVGLGPPPAADASLGDAT